MNKETQGTSGRGEGKMAPWLCLGFCICKEESWSRSVQTGSTVRVCPVEVLRPGSLG